MASGSYIVARDYRMAAVNNKLITDFGVGYRNGDIVVYKVPGKEQYMIAEIVGQFKDRFKLTVGYGVNEVKYTTFAYRGDIVSYNQYYLGVDNAKDAFVSLSN